MKHYKDKIAKLKEDFKQKYDKKKNSNKKTINANIRNKDNWVINLSNNNLSENERKVLLLGLNFSVSQSYIPKVQRRSKKATLCIRGPRESLRQGSTGRAVVLHEKIRNSGKVCTTSTGYV